MLCILTDLPDSLCILTDLPDSLCILYNPEGGTLLSFHYNNNFGINEHGTHFAFFQRYLALWHSDIGTVSDNNGNTLKKQCLFISICQLLLMKDLAMINLLAEFVLKPVFPENYRAVKYAALLATARKRLHSRSLLTIKNAFLVLSELTLSYPAHTQELIHTITGFIRSYLKRSNMPEHDKIEMVAHGLRLLLSMPRLDLNGFPYYFDLHQITIQDLDLTRSNFNFFSLWGCHFTNVLFSYSSFVASDLGGTFFENCNLEHVDVNSARMSTSPSDDGRPTRMIGTRLRGTNLGDADLEYCELQNIDNINLDPLTDKISSNRIRIIGN